VEFIWGTAITLELRGMAGRTDRALAAVARCRAWFNEVDERFSPFRELSEVSGERSGRGPHGPASPDFIAVWRACEQVRQVTGGAFDPGGRG
jgi:thiamine biosynthesis lipoprotein ApbE